MTLWGHHPALYPPRRTSRAESLRELRGLPDQLDHIEAHAGAQMHQRFYGQGVVTIQSPVDR